MKRSYWIKETSVAYTSLSDSIHVDTLVIGGGMCGLMSAYYLSHTDRRIALVEAERIGQGASGRNTGKLSAQQGFLYSDLIKTHGEAKARLYYEANRDAITALEDLINDEKINCQFRRVDAMLMALDEREQEALEKERQAYDALRIPYEVVTQPPYEMPFVKGLRMMKQAQFHPYHFMLELAQRMHQNGVAIHEHSPVTAINKQKEGYAITCNNCTIHAKSIIMATHFPISDHGNLFFTKVDFVQGDLLAAKSAYPLHDTMMINIDSDHIFSARTQIDDDGSALAILSGNQHHAGFMTLEDHDRWVKMRTRQFQLKQPILTWRNQDYVSHDRLPFIGNLIADDPSIQFASGFGKWGNTMSVVAAKTMVANLLVEMTPYAALFAPHRRQVIFQSSYFLGNMKMIKHYLTSHIKPFFPDHYPFHVRTFHENGTVYGAVEKDGKLSIVNIRCPHLGCILNYNAVDETWDCPCHGSRFTYDGKLIKGPADQDLHDIEEAPNTIDPHIID